MAIRRGVQILFLLASSLGLQAFQQPSPQDVEKDLALEFTITGDKTVWPGQSLNWSGSLVNRSKDKTYPVIKPGDGSGDGMREPFVYFTAKRKNAKGAWEEVPKSGWRRECGVYDAGWQKDIVPLKPGERIPLQAWLSFPSVMLEIQKAGPVRIQLHYRYQAGKTAAWTADNGEPDVAGMKGTGPFQITSEPFEINVIRPIDVRVKVKASMKIKKPRRLSDLLEIELQNTSKEAVSVPSPTPFQGASLRLEITGQYPGWPPSFTENRNKGTKLDLEAGASTFILGPGELAEGIDGTWTYPVEDTVKLRAHYYLHSPGKHRVVISDWVDVEVEK